ncbi:type I glyceraldehyde-3-phosphate dehydrogenase [Candidatus Daviesbacteria bacterium]|nr:type I glyceraldehyde-3-phosphate dehydrogenase [Candidatus Daviesbacteria bacterium]
MLKVAVNGFGRIGRSAFKIALDKFSNQVEIVALNDLTDAKTLAHLLKYDTAYGIWHRQVSYDSNNIIIDQKKYKVFAEKEPQNLPWKDLAVDVVIESTGKFTDKIGASLHLQAGAKKVVISAPAKGGDVPTLVLGVNGNEYKGEEVINNASCTTNCISPVVEVINNKFGVLKAMMTTIHAYTQDQNLQDGPHKDLRRARAAANNIVPTSTGAAMATTETIPSLKGLFDGVAIRVPVIVGSISDITFLLKQKVTVEGVNQALKEAAEGEVKGILAVTEEPIVSSDIVGRSESAIVDLSLTQVVDGDLVKVFAWYDNEFGYSHRLVEQVINIG